MPLSTLDCKGCASVRLDSEHEPYCWHDKIRRESPWGFGQALWSALATCAPTGKRELYEGTPDNG